MPQDLTSLLFLQNPQRNKCKISSIGLGELIAQTISEEYPSRDLINEFDCVIKEGDNISKEDYITLLTAVSQESTKKIQKLLDNRENKEVFNSEIHAMITRELNKQIEQNKQKKDALELHKQDEEKIKDLETQLNTLAESIEELQQTSKSNSDEKKDLIEELSKLKLRNWKKPRLMILGFIFAIWLCLLVLCFVVTDWDYNISAQIINWISNLDEERKDIIKKVIYGGYGFIGFFIIYCFINIVSVKTDDDKKKWFWKIVLRIVS